ncbi:MAG: hypothetical protein K9L32_02095 [Chromatiaceae bacterium]|nr:hypothetical protein [Chromatiaceae bacterium]
MKLDPGLSEARILIDEDVPDLQAANRPNNLGGNEEDAVMDALMIMQKPGQATER